MILILSTPQDEHARAVLRSLRAMGAEAVLVDLSLFPQRLGLALDYGDGGERDFRLRLPERELPLSDCTAIWWRRPQPFEPHPEVRQTAHRHFISSESEEAFAGLWQALDVRWVNHPTRNHVASHKAYQLRVASEVGLATPRTLITNEPERARAFIEREGVERTIYKAFTATEHTWRETRLLARDELALLDSVRYAPVIFQEYVPAEVDVRVTLVGEALHAAALHSQQTEYRVDFRMDMERCRVEPLQLPEEVARGLRALMERLGLVYGAVDLRRTPEGRYVFLEINPSGQWLFIEGRTGQPITESLARTLACPP